MTSAAASAPKRAEVRWSFPRDRPTRKPAANRSPAPVTSATCSTGSAATASTDSRETTMQPFSLRVTTASFASARSAFTALSKSALIGKYYIDGAFADQIKKFPAIAVDTECIGQCQRDTAPGLVGDLRRLDECFFRLWRVPQIAFEVGDRSISDLRLIDVARLQVLRGPQVCVHGSLAVRRHHDVAARCRRTATCRTGVEGDIGGADIVSEDAAEIIVLDLADKGRLRAEARDADDGVCRRPTRTFHCRAHCGVDCLRARLIDQSHRTLVHALRDQEIVLGAGDDVNDSVADTKYIVAGCGHCVILVNSARTISGERVPASMTASRGVTGMCPQA